MSEDFESRLKAAINRGRQRADDRATEARRAEMSEEERRSLHTQYRLKLSDSIEKAVHRIADHFPGFRCESVFGDAGWGTACYRDDLNIVDGRRENLYSRLELVIRPYSDLGVLDLKAKGTVANREKFNRGHYMPISDVEIDEFEDRIETWSIQYAELYAANTM